MNGSGLKEVDRSSIVKVSSPSDSILIATVSLLLTKDSQPARVWMTIIGTKKLTLAYTDRPRPSNTNLGESLHVRDSIRK